MALPVPFSHYQPLYHGESKLEISKAQFLIMIDIWYLHLFIFNANKDNRVS